MCRYNQADSMENDEIELETLDNPGSTGRSETLCSSASSSASIFQTLEDMETDQKPPETSEKPQTLYRCKRCRRIVASRDNVVPHEQGKGQSSFRWNKRSDASELERPECSSIFVEPMKWMQGVEEGHVEEKLWCLGCKARLGSFNWAGMQCSCGAWVNPAFQLHKSRVDESTC